MQTPADQDVTMGDQVLQSMKNSCTVLKGHVTRKCEEVMTHVNLITDDLCDERTLMGLRSLKDQLSERWWKLEASYEQLLEMDPAGDKGYVDSMKKYQAKYNEHLNVITQAEIHMIRTIDQKRRTAAPSVPPAASPAAPPPPRHSKANLALKPTFDLDTSHTTRELKKWVQMFKAYYESSDMHLLSLSVQHQYLRSCVSTAISARLDEMMSDVTPIFEPLPGGFCALKAINDIFLQIIPKFARRLELFRSHQVAGQLFSDFINDLSTAADEADIVSMRSHDIVIMLCLTGCRDDKLLEKLLKEQNPTVASFREITGQHERASISLKAMRSGSGSSSASAMATTTSRPRNQKKPPPPTAGMTRQDRTKQLRASGLCINCANPYSREHQCNAQGKSCHRCKGNGHISPACHIPRPEGLPSGSGGAPRADIKAITYQGDSDDKATVAMISCNVADGRPDSATPRMRGVKVKCQSESGGCSTFETHALPDTGATHTIVARSLVTGSPISQSGKTTIYTANGSELSCLGTTDLDITYQGETVRISALVTSGFADTLIVSWRDLISLRVIPSEFPNVIRTMREQGSQQVFSISENSLSPRMSFHPS